MRVVAASPEFCFGSSIEDNRAQGRAMLATAAEQSCHRIQFVAGLHARADGASIGLSYGESDCFAQVGVCAESDYFAQVARCVRACAVSE